MLTGMTIVAIVSGVRHNASELASALTGETILQMNPPSRIILSVIYGDVQV